MSTVQLPGFQRYANKILMPPFAAYRARSLAAAAAAAAAAASAASSAGTAAATMEKEKDMQKELEGNYFSRRILEQEAIAERAAALTVKPIPGSDSGSGSVGDPSTTSEALTPATPQQQQLQRLAVVLVDTSDAIFGYGVQIRAERCLAQLQPVTVPAPLSSSEEMNSTSPPTPTLSLPSILPPAPQEPALRRVYGTAVAPEVYSVLLNPTAADSFSLIFQLLLVLGYGPYLKDQRPLADFLWYSRSPAVKLLTRMKNPIHREGGKPDGEWSILGVF